MSLRPHIPLLNLWTTKPKYIKLRNESLQQMMSRELDFDSHVDSQFYESKIEIQLIFNFCLFL
jgi:hypothetical protein